MAQNTGKAFPRAMLECRPDQFKRNRRGPEPLPHRHPFDLCKTTEIADPKAANGLPLDPADHMRCAEIVAVELFIERAVLLCHINRGPHGGDAHHVVHGARRGHAQLWLMVDRRRETVRCKVLAAIRHWNPLPLIEKGQARTPRSGCDLRDVCTQKARASAGRCAGQSPAPP